MLAECFSRMRRGACATCDSRDDCRLDWWEDLARGISAWRRASQAESVEGVAARRPFLALVGEIGKAVEARARPRPTPFRDEVERHLEPRLESGQVRIDQVARGLGLSRQTLYRRLKEEGATFAGLLQ